MDEYNNDLNNTLDNANTENESLVSSNTENKSLEDDNKEKEAAFNYSYDGSKMQSEQDDLKSSSFYNESHKDKGKGNKKKPRASVKSIIVPMIVMALISSLLTAGIVVSYFTYGFPNISNNQNDSHNPQNTASTEIKQIKIIDESTSAETIVYEKVSPSIVGIRVKYVYSDWLFGNKENVGSGSGIIYDDGGHIITNNHVIEAAMTSANEIAQNAKIEVILPHQVNESYEAIVIGRDVETDIAILKIEATNLPAAEFTDSDQIKVGQKAIAIGNPAGFELMGSLSSGVVSGLNRQIEFDDGTTLKLIQIDAAINPGNSGGALLNSEGKVIGINTSKIGGMSYEGLGFAIPSNNAVEIADNLIVKGYVPGRPQIGIIVNRNFTSEVAENNGVPEGILVDEVEPLSAAYMADIQAGDIITKFDGVEIKSFEELEFEKNKYKAGDKVELLIYRMPKEGKPSQGQYKTISLTLGEKRK